MKAAILEDVPLAKDNRPAAVGKNTLLEFAAFKGTPVKRHGFGNEFHILRLLQIATGFHGWQTVA